MAATLKRAPLTQLLLTTLALSELPVGDACAPTETHGWTGQPNLPGSEFIPYTVLVPKAATDSSGSLAQSQELWKFPYLIWAYGVARDQCEWMADRTREFLAGLRGQTVDLSSATYKIQQVRTDSIGEVTRYGGSTDPSFYAQADSVSVWLG